MIANLKGYIALRQMTTLEFGKKLHPEMPFSTKSEKVMIQAKINYYATKAKHVDLSILDKMCQILKVDYNTLLGYENVSKE
jgi:DNA-binding Xre family transcriptional regulator